MLQRLSGSFCQVNSRLPDTRAAGGHSGGMSWGTTTQVSKHAQRGVTGEATQATNARVPARFERGQGGALSARGWQGPGSARQQHRTARPNESRTPTPPSSATNPVKIQPSRAGARVLSRGHDTRINFETNHPLASACKRPPPSPPMRKHARISDHTTMNRQMSGGGWGVLLLLLLLLPLSEWIGRGSGLASSAIRGRWWIRTAKPIQECAQRHEK